MSKKLITIQKLEESNYDTFNDYYFNQLKSINTLSTLIETFNFDEIIYMLSLNYLVIDFNQNSVFNQSNSINYIIRNDYYMFILITAKAADDGFVFKTYIGKPRHLEVLEEMLFYVYSKAQFNTYFTSLEIKLLLQHNLIKKLNGENYFNEKTHYMMLENIPSKNINPNYVTIDSKIVDIVTTYSVKRKWVKWSGNGGSPEFADDITIDVKFRDGSDLKRMNPNGFRWEHLGNEDDIIEYRIVNNGTIEPSEPVKPVKPLSQTAFNKVYCLENDTLQHKWIQWKDNGDIKLQGETKIDIVSRDDSYHSDRNIGDFQWSHSGSEGDIITYRKHLSVVSRKEVLDLHHKLKMPKEIVIQPELIFWKNPKPKVQNKKVIIKGDFVNIEGQQLALQVTSTTKVSVFVKIAGKATIFSKDECYPVYEQNTNEVKPGDVVYVSTTEFPRVVKKNIDGAFIDSQTIKHKFNTITKVYNKNKIKAQFLNYKCGVIEYEGKVYKNIKTLENQFQHIIFKADVQEITHEHAKIASHYGMSHAEVKPKENDIGERLKVALDHPLNVKAKEWAILVGPSGSGKTEMAVDYANSVGKKYIKLQGNAQVTVDDLIGYKSITTGEYFSSLLRDAVENGHIFILDEIDSCNPNTLLTLNGLKQEYFQFPDKLIKIHKDFRMIATANTLEYSEEYNSRTPMDKATKARFDVIEYTMSACELAVRYGLNHIKEIPNIDRLTPREVSRVVTKMKIAGEK